MPRRLQRSCRLEHAQAPARTPALAGTRAQAAAGATARSTIPPTAPLPRTATAFPPRCSARSSWRGSPDVGEAYEVGGEQLGVGQFGVIRACVSRSTGQVLACKAISKARILAQEDAEDVAKEVRVMQQLRGHPHIVKIHRALEDHQSVHIIMEICRGGDLFDRVKAGGRLSERSAAAVTGRLVEALLWCHGKGVVHRDVKLENILLKQRGSDTDIRLTDFGMAAEVRPGEVLTELIGTPYYMAPEVLAGSYGAEADIWSAGVVLYILLCGLPPFYAASNEGIFDAIRSKPVQFKAAKWNGVSSAAKQLISSMLEKNPRDRITGDEVLEHPWIKAHAFDD
ncbi:unnamed protein product [Closterium sp. Yama58-4]|nr:unnamed protein product [Closterium sp. Yama58-4]